MNWDDLRYFLTLCREGSVSRAGKTLQVNHTTVARRITALEASLGTRLFDRTPEGYAMTQAAEDMYADALAMEERAQAIDRQMFGQDSQLKGRLKVTVPYDFANHVLMPHLDGFRKSWPHIDLELLTTTGLMDLAAREADVAVRLTEKPPDYLIGRKVLPLRHGIYGAPTLLRKLDDRPPIIVYRRESGLPEWAEQHFAGAPVVLRTDNASTILAAVRNGLGIARMPCFMGDFDSSIRRLDLDMPLSPWGVWILSHVDLRSTARVRVARDYLADIIEAERAFILGERSRYF